MQRQSPRPPSLRPLPSRRTRADQYLATVRAFCLHDSTFTARSLEALAGVPAPRIQLTLSFWRSCGLLERAPGRGAYRPTKTARSLASAWRQGNPQGARALGEILRKQWYSRTLRARLQDGPGQRTGLVTRLMRGAQVGDEYRLEVEMLIDLMVAVGLLQPQPDNQLRWCEDAVEAPERADIPATSTVDESRPAGNPAESTDRATETPDTGRDPAPEEPQPGDSTAKVPPPRSADNDSLVALLSHPVRLVDLASLSAEELLSVHGHITALAAAATKLRSRPASHLTD